MKTLIVVVLTIFLGKGCSQETKNDMANTTIEYTANTRGFYKKITIQNQEVFVSTDRNSTEKGTASAISDADWKELVTFFETVELDSLASYKDPTQKRFYDGAAMADVKIKHKDKEYQTVTFDHGFPPAEIEKLVNKITSLSKDE
jgi:hypothetical protein